MYKIIRSYLNAGINKRVIDTSLTLAEVQAHCKSPEASSETCTKPAGKARTRKVGCWFDGYDKM